jgi:hypothetical protein
MWNDPAFFRAFISCLSELQLSRGFPLTESQTLCLSDACSTLLNLITHLRDASSLPGHCHAFFQPFSFMHFINVFTGCAIDICEALAEACDAIRSRKINSGVGSLLLKVTSIHLVNFFVVTVVVYDEASFFNIIIVIIIILIT